MTTYNYQIANNYLTFEKAKLIILLTEGGYENG